MAIGQKYIRTFDKFENLPPYPNFNARGYRNQMLSAFESAVMIVSHIEEGGCGPALHYHKSDQIYFLLEGSTEVQLGHESYHAETGSIVFIPAGLAHGNHNDGPGRETHFEIIAPCPRPSVPIVYLVDSPDDVPAEDRTDRIGFVKNPGELEYVEPLPGFRMAPLVGALDSQRIIVNLAEVDPGKSGPGTHIHEFDQYYLVREGQLGVEIALHQQVVGPEEFVAIPAGVPHRMYNASNTEVEKHLVMISPPPDENSGPWDVGCLFEPNGISHGGMPRTGTAR